MWCFVTLFVQLFIAYMLTFLHCYIPCIIRGGARCAIRNYISCGTLKNECHGPVFSNPDIFDCLTNAGTNALEEIIQGPVCWI